MRCEDESEEHSKLYFLYSVEHRRSKLTDHHFSQTRNIKGRLCMNLFLTLKICPRESPTHGG